MELNRQVREHHSIEDVDSPPEPTDSDKIRLPPPQRGRQSK